MGKKKGAAWTFFRVDDKKVICKYCAKQYKHANVNKMEKHIISCFKCPKDLKNVFFDNSGRTSTKNPVKTQRSKPEINMNKENIVEGITDAGSATSTPRSSRTFNEASSSRFSTSK